MAVPYAVSRGVARSVPRSVPSRLFGGGLLSSTFLSTYGPYGMAMDFTDASISINDVTDVLDYNSQGTISSTTGALLGPGSKLTYSAPSAKLTEQADGFLAFQAHNLLLQSEAHATAPWNVAASGTGVAPTRTNGYAAGPFGGSATRLQFSLGGGTTGSDISSVQQSITPPVAGGEYTRNVWIRSTDGSSSYVMQVQAVDGSATNVAITGTWTKYTVTGISAGVLSLSLRLRGGQTTGAGANSNTADVLVANDHLCRTPSVSTYVATTSAAVYGLPYVFSGGVRTGILVEPAATNLATNNTLASGYGGAQAAASDVTTSGPISGLTTMIGLTDNGNNANHGLYNNAVNTASATDYAISAIVKPGARNYAGIGISVDANNYICAVFDLSSGTFGQTSVGGTSGTIAGSGTAYGIMPLANGCYRIWIAGRVTGLGTPHAWAANAASGNSFGTLGGPTYTGNGTVAIYTTVLQVETGTVATSPIITYGGSVFRAADNIAIATTLFPLSTTAETLYSGFTLLSTVTTDIAKLKPTSGIAEIFGFYHTSSSIVPIVRNGGSVSFAEGSSLSPVVGAHKYAMAAEVNNARGALDGTLSIADTTSVTMPGTVNLLTLGSGNGSYGGSSSFLLSVLAYFPERKADATLQTLTTA